MTWRDEPHGDKNKKMFLYVYVLCFHMSSTCQGQLSLSAIEVVLFDLAVLMHCVCVCFSNPINLLGVAVEN